MREYNIYATVRILCLKQLAERFIRQCVKEDLKILMERPESVSVTYGQLENDLYAFSFALFYFELHKNSIAFLREGLHIPIPRCLPKSSNKALLIAHTPEKGIQNFGGIMDTPVLLEYGI